MNKGVPFNLTALGSKRLPDTIQIGGRPFTQRQVFKDDFFAVTALYQCETRKVLLKVHRRASFLLLPMQWLGRILANREWAMLQRARHIPGIPEPIERWGPTGILREFIEGQPLQKGEPVPDGFHEQLRSLVGALHARRMAYVDLEKCDNVLVGDDGQPYLFDFQIAWYLPPRLGGELYPLRTLRAWLQRGDRYHLLKLQRRTRPDQLSPEQLAASYRKPWYVRVHRWVTIPFTRARRALLDRVDPRDAQGERGRILKTPDRR